MNNLDSYIRIRVEQELKEKAQKYCSEKGINLSNLLRMLLIEKMEG